MSVFTGFGRFHSDHMGVPTIITVSLSLERCTSDHNGAGKSVTVAESLKLYSRLRNGGTRSGTLGGVTSAGFQPCNTVTEPGILPNALRHRFRA